MKATLSRLGGSCSVGMIPTRNSDTSKPDRYRLAAILDWKQVPFCALAMALLAVPVYAQKGTSTGGGSAPRRPPSGIITAPGDNGRGPSVWQAIADAPPLPKPVIADDEKCLPWNVSEVRATVVSVARLTVPSKARREFEKACDASNKNQFTEAEQHARSAIDKFQSYAAAWVMLGVILEEQHKAQEARDACAHATTIDATYLPAYLCAAEFSVRNQDWEQVLNLANLSLGLNPGGDAYAYYYRAVAFFHTNKRADAKKSALAAAEIDVNQKDAPLYFLLARIYDAEGDKVNAAVQLRKILKHHTDREQEDAAKQYLAKLEAQQSTK
jgi:hypothetical protein